jgi:diaminopimelate epimerase
VIVSFEKYQGTGNDFVMLDNRNGHFDELTIETIQYLCNRKFGIGADGLIWVKHHPTLDFEMRYFNADGSRSFCGNGARCAVKFAQSLNMFSTECRFLAIDGEHYAFESNNQIHLQMADVDNINQLNDAWILDTGSPHYVEFCNTLGAKNIVEYGKEIRYSPQFKEKGINVNLVAEMAEGISMETYERGVEDETLSCGTGATAAAIVFAQKKALIGEFKISVQVKGGQLAVSGRVQDNRFTDLFLIGPATKVFHGEIAL